MINELSIIELGYYVKQLEDAAGRDGFVIVKNPDRYIIRLRGAVGDNHELAKAIITAIAEDIAQVKELDKLNDAGQTT